MGRSDSSNLFHVINHLANLYKLGTPNLVTQIEGTLKSNSKNDKSQKRDDASLIWSDALPQLSIGQPPDQCQKDKCCHIHTTCIN
jgi:hypothetical protein